MVTCACAHQLQEILCESTSLAGESARSPSVVSKFRNQSVKSYTCRNRHIVAIPSQMCVFVHFYPLHGIDLATCFGALTHFLISQNNTCMDVQPLFPFGVSRLSEGSLLVGWTRWKVKISFTVLPSSTVSSCCCGAYQPSPLEDIHSSGVHTSFGTEKRDILKCVNSHLCGSGLHCQAYERFLCFVNKSQ